MARSTRATRATGSDGASRVVASVVNAEKTAIDAVRNFVDSVNRAFPDVVEDGGTRQHIIDSAFKMTEQLVGASNDLAQRVVDGGHAAATRVPARKAAAKKAAARRAAPRKAAAKKATARKASAKKAAARKTTARKSPPKKAAAKRASTR